MKPDNVTPDTGQLDTFPWRWGRVLVITLAALGTLVALFYAVENWRGKQAWLKFKRASLAQGESFDLASVVPPVPPPDENFAMTPFFAPLLDYRYEQGRIQWRDTNALRRATAVGISSDRGRARAPNLGRIEAGHLTDLRKWQSYYRSVTNYPSPAKPGAPAADVLLALDRFQPVLEELRAASRRPQAVFPVHYDEVFMALLPHLAVFKRLALLTRLRAQALLESGHPAKAADEIKLGLRLAESVKTEPLLISQLVRLASMQIVIAGIWEGLARQQWRAADLQEFQGALERIRVLEDYGRAMRGERAFGIELAERWRRDGYSVIEAVQQDSGELSWAWRLAPRGWIYRNQLLLGRFYQETALPLVDAERHRVYPERAVDLEAHAELHRPTPFYLLARLVGVPAMTGSALKFAFGQTRVDQALAACALERYRLAEGRYPDQLEALVPRFLGRVPADVIDGQPIRYRNTGQDRFILYSIGWNRVDDGGKTAKRKPTSEHQDLHEGDWVWQYPAAD